VYLLGRNGKNRYIIPDVSACNGPKLSNFSTLVGARMQIIQEGLAVARIARDDGSSSTNRSSDGYDYNYQPLRSYAVRIFLLRTLYRSSDRDWNIKILISAYVNLQSFLHLSVSKCFSQVFAMGRHYARLCHAFLVFHIFNGRL